MTAGVFIAAVLYMTGNVEEILQKINNFSGNKNPVIPVSLGMVDKQIRFNALVNALYSDLYRYAFWLTKNASIAEDLVQETYLRAWKSIDKLKDDKAAKAWLITILRRENARLYERYKPELYDVEDFYLEDRSAQPGQMMENHILQETIARLDIEFREPITLQIIGGFSVDEISGILELNKNTVLSRLYRARSKLKQVYTELEVNRGVRNG